MTPGPETLVAEVMGAVRDELLEGEFVEETAADAEVDSVAAEESEEDVELVIATEDLLAG